MDGDKSLNQCDEMGLPDLGGLSDLSLNQSKEMELPDLDLPGLPGLPDLPDLPDLPHLPDLPDDLEEHFKNLLTDTPCGNDETLVSGGIPNLGIEMIFLNWIWQTYLVLFPPVVWEQKRKK